MLLSPGELGYTCLSQRFIFTNYMYKGLHYYNVLFCNDNIWENLLRYERNNEIMKMHSDSKSVGIYIVMLHVKVSLFWKSSLLWTTVFVYRKATYTGQLGLKTIARNVLFINLKYKYKTMVMIGIIVIITVSGIN